MRGYVLRRLAMAVPVFLGATFLVWAFVFAMPGDPIRALTGFRPQPPEVNRALREQYNLNDPLLIQYVKYLIDVLRFDFGSSFTGVETSDLLKASLPHTIRIVGIAVGLEVVVGGIAGFLAAMWHRRFADCFIMVATLVLISVPAVVIAPLAWWYLSVDWGWFPRRGTYDGWRSYVLPGLILGLLSLASLTRLLRATLIESLQEPYVRMATAKGLRRRRVVGIHAMRNSLVPVVSYFGSDIAVLLAGTAVVETVFSIPGAGQLLVQASRDQETPVVLGVVTFLVVIVIVVNLIVDIAYGIIDPRVRSR